MLGQHGIWEKQKFFEASVRVPLIIRWPQRFPGGGVVEQNVNQCDLFATLCDLAGRRDASRAGQPETTPLMEGNAWEWDDETISQFGGRNCMIKRGALKYQYYGPDMAEVLFDLERDPGETTNYMEEPGYAEEVAAFRQRLASLGFGPDADPNYVNAGYNMR